MVANLGKSLSRGKLSFRKSAKAFCEKPTFALILRISVSSASNFE